MANRSDVFISYRRVDVEFAKQIDAALKATGREVWVDWEDIPPGVEGFTEEIQQGIEGADAVIAILSPSYLESEYCIMELRESLRLKKRVIPIVLKKFEPLPPPEGIGHINWIYFVPHAGQENPFDESFKKIIQALEADNDHTRNHTRLLMRAVEWEKGKKNPSYLLKGQELASAETWQVSAHAKNPPPSELQSEYILASRAQQVKQQRQILFMIAGFLVLAGVAAIFAAYQAVEAKRQEGIAQDARQAAETQQAVAQIARDDAEAQRVIAVTSQAEAEHQAELAQTSQANAENQAERAQIARDEAENQRIIAVTSQANAETQREVAVTAQANAETQREVAVTAQANAETQREIAVTAQAEAERQALEAHSLALSASAQSAGNENIAVALALEAARIGNPPREVLYNLFNVAYRPGVRNHFMYSDTTLAENLNFFNNPAISPDGRYMVIRNSLIEIATGDVIRTFEGAPNLVLSSAFTPDGTRVVLGGDIDPFTPADLLAEIMQNPIYLGIWDVATGQLLNQLDTGSGVSYVQVSDDGTRLASFVADDHFYIWEMASGRRLGDYLGNDRAALNSDLRLMAYQKSVEGFRDGSFYYTIEVRNIRNDLEVFTIGFPTFASSISMKFDNTSTQLAVITDNYLSLINMNTAYLYSLAGHSARITSVDFSENQVVTASEDQKINIWDRTSGELVQTFNGHDISVIYADFINSQQLVSLDLSGNVMLWDTYSGDWIRTDPNDEVAQYGTMLRYNQDKTRAVYEIIGEDGNGTIVLLNTSNNREIQSYSIPNMISLSQALFSPNGESLILVKNSALYQMQILKLDLVTGESEELYSAESLKIDLSPDGQTILVAQYGFTDFTSSRIFSYNLAERRENFSIDGIPDTLFFLKDGQRFLSAEYPSNASWTVSYILRNAQTGEFIRTITTDAPPIDSFQLSNDESLLLTSAARFDQDTVQTISGIDLEYGTKFDYVYLWNFQTGALIRNFQTHGGILSLSEDEQSFTVRNLNEIQQWRLDSTDGLLGWTCANRNVPEFTPEQRQLFNITTKWSICRTQWR